jgi:hypothetical protein
MKRNKSRNLLRCGLHIGSHELRLAVISQSPEGARRLTLDSVRVDSSSPSNSLDWLPSALGELLARHDLRRAQWSVTLDGDFCVARVVTGSPEEVTAGLDRLRNRVPRYLSLGPGEKITGGFRESINKTTDYAVTGVANRKVLEHLKATLDQRSIRPLAVEPSLVAVARQLNRHTNSTLPALIADGSGRQWDVGISQQGRLLLDYRPSGTRDANRFGEILLGHLSRLHRFCERHRHVDQMPNWSLFLFGPESKVVNVSVALQNLDQIIPVPLKPSALLGDVEYDEASDTTEWVGAIAAALTLCEDRSSLLIADLFSALRNGDELTTLARWTRTLAPLAAAAVILLSLSLTVSQQNRRIALNDQQLPQLTESLARLRSQAATGQLQQQLLLGFKRLDIAAQSVPKWESLLALIPRAMPDATKLGRIQLGDDGSLRLNGTAADETTVYELVTSLKKLPGVQDVLLQGTNPTQVSDAELNPELLTTANQVDFSIMVKLDVGNDRKEA